MAYNDRDSDKKPAFPLYRITGEGNMVEDPKDLGKEGNPFVVFKMAFNSRNSKEYEGSQFVSASVGSTMAERVLADGAKGKRITVGGMMYKDESWENKDGDLVEAFSLRIDEIGESWRFAERGAGGSSRRRRGDDDDEPRGRSGRSGGRSSRDDEDDEPRGRSGRSSRTSEEDDEPRGGRSGRSSRTSRDDDEPRGGRTRRSRGAVEDNGDAVDD